MKRGAGELGLRNRGVEITSWADESAGGVEETRSGEVGSRNLGVEIASWVEEIAGPAERFLGRGEETRKWDRGTRNEED